MSTNSDDLPDLDKFDTPSADAYGQSRNGGFNVVTDGERCGAKTRGTGEPCKKHPAYGTNRCRLHGGASPQAMAKAAREKHMTEVEGKLRDALDRFAVEPIADPLTALQQLAGEVWAWKELLLEKVGLLDKLRYSTEFNEQIRGEVLLYERALDRAAAVLASIAKLNIDERLAAVSEAVAKRIEDGLFDAFDEAGVPITDPDQRERVAIAFGRHLAIAAA